MAKEIKVTAYPSETSPRTFTYNVGDMGYTDEEWDALPPAQKTEAVQKELDSEPEHPYWALDEIED